MSVIKDTNILPNLILILPRLQIELIEIVNFPLRSNVYDDVTYFCICGFHKNIKIYPKNEAFIFR